MEKKRYQECSLMVKLWRRIRYQPICYLRASLIFLKVLIKSLVKREPEYIFEAELAFKIITGEWCTNKKANYYWSWDEVVKQYKNKCKIRND